eukprot:TRINITY_DN76450_c0_g1_i1.p1 TRINITY_DN76450_c0_g1~~TRINITY_DN76450_c0_g1_i1.p1  ORF type:complete len:674 (+),score=106.15 TRINITY_DN76450_c0_g1_i1:66-2087(+)
MPSKNMPRLVDVVKHCCQKARTEYWEHCTTPPASWAMQRTKRAHLVSGGIFLFYAVWGFAGLYWYAPDMYDDGFVTPAALAVMSLSATASMLAKCLTTARCQELVLVVSMFVSLTCASLESATYSEKSLHLNRYAAVTNWRMIALFAPLAMQWRLVPSCFYGVSLMIKDYLMAFVVADMGGEPEAASRGALLTMTMVNVLISCCYLGFLGVSRDAYLAEVLLQEEKDALKSLLRVQCDVVVSLDKDRVITSEGMESLMGESMVGERLETCLRPDEERINWAFEACRSQKQAMLFKSELCSRGGMQEQPVDVFVVCRRGVHDSFLVGLSCSGERPPPGVDLSMKAATVLTGGTNIISASDSVSVTGAPSFMGGSENAFGRAIEQQSTSSILALAKREHWLVQKGDLDFEDSAVLGSGSFGTVSTAVFYGSTVAVKSARSERQDSFKTALLELRMLRHLRHPNIIGFLGAVVDVESLCVSLVFEYAEGGTLLILIQQIDCKAWPREHVDLMQSCLQDASSGLYYMHSLTPPMVHRDIKPSNVLIAFANQGLQARLSDFGLSHLQGKDSKGGTPSMMAPEAFTSDRVLAAADVFSFGRLLFAASVGEMPLRGFTRKALKDLAERGQVPTLVWPSVPWPRCKQLAERCMASNVGDRVSAKEISSEIRTWKRTPLIEL